jgi:hypothetical protein
VLEPVFDFLCAEWFAEVTRRGGFDGDVSFAPTDAGASPAKSQYYGPEPVTRGDDMSRLEAQCMRERAVYESTIRAALHPAVVPTTFVQQFGSALNSGKVMHLHRDDVPDALRRQGAVVGLLVARPTRRPDHFPVAQSAASIQSGLQVVTMSDSLPPTSGPVSTGPAPAAPRSPAAVADPRLAERRVRTRIATELAVAIRQVDAAVDLLDDRWRAVQLRAEVADAGHFAPRRTPRLAAGKRGG